MRHYETVFILTPVLSDVQIKEAVGKYTDLIKASGAKIENQENWGLRKLAYPIQKKSTGFYNLVEFSTENADIIADLELALKRDEKILRFLTVKLDKHAIAWAKKRKDTLKAAKA